MRFPLAVILPVLTALLSGVPAAAQNTASAPVRTSANEPARDRLAADIALAKATISRLQAGDFTAVREQLDRSVGPVPDDVLRRMSDVMGTREPTSVETISATETHNVQTGDGVSRILLEYRFATRWVVAEAVVKTVGAEKRFPRLHFTSNTMPLSELNTFHLFGKGPLQYLFLTAWLLAIAVTGCAAWIAFRRHTGWRRWILMVLMPLGLTPTLAVNWNTAQTFIVEAVSNSAGYTIPLFAVRYPMTVVGHTETGAPFLCISLPLIAIAYLIWQWTRGRPARPQAS